MENSEILKQAAAAERDRRWADASEMYLQLAHGLADTEDFELASEYFMRAATNGERTEDWRRLGMIWLQCANAVECRCGNSVQDVTDRIDQSRHYFPTVDHFTWKKFNWQEQLGRAYRNAAYHLEKAGANQSAYDQYKRSGDIFREAGLFDQATRSYYHALVSFAEHHGEIDSEALNAYALASEGLLQIDSRKYLKRIQIHYRGIAGKLTYKGNYADASRLFCMEANVSRRIALTERRIFRWSTLTVWKVTSSFGTNPVLWGFWAVVLFGLLFPAIFALPGILTWQDSGRSPTIIDYVYFSISTLVAGSDPSFTLSLRGKCWSLAESGIGLIMIGSFLSLFSKKFVR